MTTGTALPALDYLVRATAPEPAVPEPRVVAAREEKARNVLQVAISQCSMLHRRSTHCTVLQRREARCNTVEHGATELHVATQSNALPRNATQCSVQRCNNL